MNIIKSGFEQAYNMTTQIAIPEAISSVIRAGCDDYRIGKIVGGLGLFFTGISCVNKSEVLRNIRPYCSGAESKPLINEGISKKATRWGVASFGIAAACYGIYSFASGILEFMEPKFMEPDGSYTRNSDTCQMRLERTKEGLLSCSKAEEIWQQVTKEGAFSIHCANTTGDAQSEMKQDSLVHSYFHKTDSLVFKNNTRSVPELLFEMNHLKHVKYEELHSFEGTNKCQVSRDEYEDLIEGMTYDAFKDTHDISEDCIKNGTWPIEWRSFHDEFTGTSQENNWTTRAGFHQTFEDKGYVDSYRTKWQNTCGKNQ